MAVSSFVSRVASGASKLFHFNFCFNSVNTYGKAASYVAQ